MDPDGTVTSGSWVCRSAGWMPCAIAALMTFAMVQAYVWAVCRSDVKPWMPFISSAAGNPPQSGLFAIFIFLSVVVGLATVVARHTVLHREALRQNSDRLRALNHTGLAMGLVCLSGMLMVAAYPVHTWTVPSKGHITTSEDLEKWRSSVMIPHTVGATVCLAVGFLYSMCQALLSVWLRPPLPLGFWTNKHRHLFLARVTACVVALAALLGMCLGRSDNPDPWKNTKGTTGRAVAEWILALMLTMLFFSLYPEMNTVRVEIRVSTGVFTPPEDNIAAAIL